MTKGIVSEEKVLGTNATFGMHHLEEVAPYLLQ